MSSPIVEIRVGSRDTSPVLDAFRRDRTERAFIMGPLGSGKTFGCIQRILATMLEQEPNIDGERLTRWFIVRNTFSQLETSTMKDFLAVFTPSLGELRLSKPPTYTLNWRLEDGTTVKSEVIFLALDREEEAVSKIRGTQVTGVWLNETKELDKGVLDMLDYRQGRYPSMGDGKVWATWSGIIGDTNAPDTDHWYYKLAEETKPEGWAFFRQPGGVMKVNGNWVANPKAENLNNLRDQYYTRGLGGKTEDWIAVNLGNEYGFSIDGKPVHPGYLDSVHCPGEIAYNPFAPIVLGVDFGRTPAACFWQPRCPGGYDAIDEFCADDMSQAVFAPELRRYIQSNYPNARVRGWGDPAGDAKGQATEDTPMRIMRAAGFSMQPAPSNNPTLRRAALANPLSRLAMDRLPGARISSRCKRLRKGLAGAWSFQRLKVAGQERYNENPNKGPYSHICEASEYGLLGEGEGQAALMPADPYYRDEEIQLFAEM